MEQMKLFFDPEIWRRELRTLQRKCEIYPASEGNETSYRRSALLLSDLFTKLFKEHLDFLTRDFYLLGRKFGLNCKHLYGIEFETKLKEERLYLWPPGYTNLELIKATKVSLGLSLKTLDEVENGIDVEIMINFFNFLYRHCRSGFLCIRKFLGPSDWNFFFDIKNGFEPVLEFILSETRKSEEQFQRGEYGNLNAAGSGFAFCKALFSTPVCNLSAASEIPTLFIDVDNPTEREEEPLEKFKIWPSIKLKTSPRGWHFYWLLKTPAKASEALPIMRAQYSLAKLLGGDLNLNRFDVGIVSRMPGMFNFGYWPPHFVDYETTSFEYDLGNFDHLPGLSFLDQIDFFKKLWKG